MNDYRNSQYCQKLEDIKSKKAAFKSEILKDHPRTTNFYVIIRDEDGDLKKKFLKLFNNKCVYCGNSLENINIGLMEIDHYINKASFNPETNAHTIENLVPACKKCNRGKASITLDAHYSVLLNPEDNSISAVFERDKNYRICIRKEYSTDDFIKDFYEKLKLNDELRRLDYLLLNLRGLSKQIEKSHSDISDQLNTIIVRLNTIRNSNY